MTNYCSKCGTPLTDGNPTCPRCGAYEAPVGNQPLGEQLNQDLGKVERTYLFPAFRLLAFVSMLFIMLGAVWGGYTYLSLTPDTAIDYKDVKVHINPPPADEDSAKAIERKLKGLDIPANVAKQFKSEENRNILVGWLQRLDKEQRQDFVYNLAEIIDSAEKNNDDLKTVINAYKEIKLQKLVRSDIECK